MVFSVILSVFRSLRGGILTFDGSILAGARREQLGCCVGGCRRVENLSMKLLSRVFLEVIRNQDPQ
jgi:hypothetical protein